MEVKFRLHELRTLEKHPDALQAVADYNDQMAAGAEAQGYSECIEFHEKRAREFEAEAKRVRAEWEGPWPHTPDCRKSPEGSMGGAFSCSCGAESQSDGAEHG